MGLPRATERGWSVFLLSVEHVLNQQAEVLALALWPPFNKIKLHSKLL